MGALIHWIVGPQLVGFIMLFAGWIQQSFPPTDVDGLYGYRTNTSRQNQQTFDEGNRYSSKLLMRLGAIALIAGLIITPFIDEKHAYISGVLTVVAAIGISIILILRTERHLKKMFNN